MGFEDAIVAASKAESSLTNEPATPDPQEGDGSLTQGAQAPILPQGATQNVQPGSQPTAAKVEPQGFDYEWWKKDPRFGKIWKSDRDVIKSAYESDKILETKYKPAYKQYEGIVKKLKEFGYDSDKIDDFFNEHKTLKDPENPVNALGNLLLQWQGDPFVPDIEQFFKDLELKKMQRDYPGMTMQQVNEFRSLQQKLADIEKRESDKLAAEQAAKNEELKSKVMEEVKVQFAAIEQEAKDLGIEFTDELKEKLYQRGIQTSMEPSLLPLAFRQMVKDQYDKSYENKVKSKILESQDKSKRTTVPLSRGANKITSNKSFVEKFAEAIKNEKSKT
jgi:hypothetical protein